MAQLEELLEKKPDAVSEDMGYSTPSDAYPEDEWEKQKLKRLLSISSVSSVSSILS